MSFDELRIGRSRRSRGCPVCGQPNAGTLQLNLRALNGGPHIASRTINLCERHASEIFALLRDELERRASS